MAQRPLMLKDFLELEANSESCDGFICAPDLATVRSLLEAEFGVRLIRTRSKGTLTRISAVINAVKWPRGRFNPRSFPKKLMRSFWKKGEAAEEFNASRVRVGDIMRLRSFDEDGEDRRSVCFTSPVVSSAGSDFLLSCCGSSDYFGENRADADADAAGDCKGESELTSSNPGPKGRMDGENYREPAAGGREAEEGEGEGMECTRSHSEEEKEQLSPVSVMDFPYHDEEGEDEEEEEEDTVSPSFHQSLANIERARRQLLQKIRRFESLAELDPVDLDDSFASSEEPLDSSDHVASDGEDEHQAASTVEERRARDLMLQLKDGTPWGPQGGCVGKLLLGFFVEGLSSSRDFASSAMQWRRHAKVNIASHHGPTEEELLDVASDWLGGGRRGGCREGKGEAQLREMERNGGWRCVMVEEEEDVAVDVEVRMLGWLLEELVLDLVPC